MLYVISCFLFLGCIPARIGQVMLVSLDIWHFNTDFRICSILWFCISVWRRRGTLSDNRRGFPHLRGSWILVLSHVLLWGDQTYRALRHDDLQDGHRRHVHLFHCLLDLPPRLQPGFLLHHQVARGRLVVRRIPHNVGRLVPHDLGRLWLWHAWHDAISKDGKSCLCNLSSE